MKQLVFILFTGLAFSGWAQQSRLSLTDCIAYTLEHHPSIKVYHNRMLIAKDENWQNVSDNLPQVSGKAVTIDNLSLQSSIFQSDFIGPDPVKITMGSKYTTDAYIDVSQRLFDPTGSAKIRSNTFNSERAALEARQNEENLIYKTATSFFQILIFTEQCKILQVNRAKYEEMHQVLHFQHEKGAALEKDVNRMVVNLNSTQYQIKDAETRLGLAYNTLKHAMGMRVDTPLEIDTSSDYEHYVQQDTAPSGVNTRTDYKLYENDVARQKSKIEIEQAGYYPTLHAVGRFGYQSVTNKSSEVYSAWQDFSYIGLSLEIPIFHGLKKRARVQESRTRWENEVQTLKMNGDRLQLEYENARTSLGTAYANFKSNEGTMTLAKEVVDVTEYQYRKGVSSMTDYLNDDTAYRNAQSDYLNSLYNLLISELNFHQAKGTLRDFVAQIH